MIARWFRRYFKPPIKRGFLAVRWDERLRRNGRVTVLIMRLVCLPFDLVNFACGLTDMRQFDFAIGTFIGIMLALIAFDLFGWVAGHSRQNRVFTFTLAILCCCLGLLIAKLVGTERGRTANIPDDRLLHFARVCLRLETAMKGGFICVFF